MSIVNITTNFTGQVDVQPRMVRIETTNTLAEVTAPDFLKSQISQFQPEDAALVSLKDNSTKLLNIEIENGTITLVAETGGVKLPVVDGDFALFSGVDGLIEDKGYSPTDASKTKVVMADGATKVNLLAKYSDVDGTIHGGPGTASNEGNIEAGTMTGPAGKLISHPTTPSRGIFSLEAVENVGNQEVKIQNEPVGQNTTFTVPNPVQSSASLLISKLAISEPNVNMVQFVVTVTAAQLAGLALVPIIVSGVNHQYVITDIVLNEGLGLIGGDRLLHITDLTNVFSVIPTAAALVPINARWGDTDLSYPVGAAMSTPSQPGFAIGIQAFAGISDYSTGSIGLAITAIRVA